MRLIISLLFVVASLQLDAAENISIGEHFEMYSESIGEVRPISVYVPEDIKKDERLFVIYLLDSEQHFHTVSGIVKSLSQYEQIPKAMVVGIHSTDRPRDFFPEVEGEPQTEFQTFVKSKWPESGQAKFINFLEKELVTYIDKHYPTYPHKTIIGHSNGGTLALSALFDHSELFTNYLTISPNGWWSDDQITHNAKKLTKENRQKNKLFISVASEGSRFYTGTVDLLSSMEKQKPVNLDWQFKHFPEKTHMSSILPAITEGLAYLYADFNFKVTPELAKYADVSALQGHYNDLTQQYGFDVPVPVDIYVEFAQQQQSHTRNQAALNTLHGFVNDYPKYSYAHMRLAQGYAALDNHVESHKSFVNALTLAKKQKRETYIIDALQDMVNDAKQKL